LPENPEVNHAGHPNIQFLVYHETTTKICLLVHKCLHQLAPPYLVSLLTPVTTILVICGPLTLAIWPQRWEEQWASVLEASRLLVHQHGTVCHQSSRKRHWQFSWTVCSPAKDRDVLTQAHYASAQHS